MGIASSIQSFSDSLLSWLGVSLKQSTASYCKLQTADSSTVLVNHDGSLLSLIEITGVTYLIGQEEFDYVQAGVSQSLQTVMSQPGQSIQFVFSHSADNITGSIAEIYSQARTTCRTLNLDVEDLFSERIDTISSYCSDERVYVAIWTKVESLTREQMKRSNADKRESIEKNKIPPFTETQNLIAAVAELRDRHDSVVRSFNADLSDLAIVSRVLDVHDAVHVMRTSADPDLTDIDWRAVLPGDKVTIKELKRSRGHISDVMWPNLAKQIIPRDARRLNLRYAQVGDRIYSSVYIDLFPQTVQPFHRLFNRVLQAQIPWRISFLIDSHGMGHSNIRGVLASVLTFTSGQNRLIADSLKLLNYINLNTDDSVVRLRVVATTYVYEHDYKLLGSRVSLLAKALESWGSCDVSQYCGDAFQGVVSSMVGVNDDSPAQASIAPLSDVLYMLPFFRPSSPWESGAILFRTPDGKPWPYHPGSRMQTTFIDLIYARPGSGKSVLSNSINLAVCMSPGIIRLPRIAIIDIGPSSSGLISLLRDALPVHQKHLVGYYRLSMSRDYSINPFDTQLGCRLPTPQERTFLVNFLTLLATPVGAERSYDGVADMSGLIIDELYSNLKDENNPNIYSPNIEGMVDGLLEEIGFITDSQTSWWEVTDALFVAGFYHEATLAQRYAMPVLADVVSICRASAIEDLYGRITSPTGEPLIHAFSRMISSAVREYPIISQVTQFDLGDAKVVALDLDEVAKSGGDAANRQTAVMYMLARYTLAKDYYLVEDNVKEMPDVYRDYHLRRILEIRDDPKRIVYDEFHRTAKTQAVRDQVIVDMREGRKWKVQISLLSQSLDDFDSVMIEFATSIFIMEAGPESAVRKTAQVFGLSSTAQKALRNRVHGPREGGATFLAQFSTKYGQYTQLLMNTLGPIELWALNTTAEDVNIRNQLYKKLGPKRARQVLAKRFPGGTATKVIETLLADKREDHGFIDDNVATGVISQLVDECIELDKG